MKIKGFDKLQKQLKQLERNAKELEQTTSVSFAELFTDSFMKTHTSFDEMLDKSKFTVETSEDFKAIPDDEWDIYVKSNTEFNTWQDMIDQATEEYIVRKLDL
ncbi:hypothetical protein CWO92_18310 [Heyndrickxia camelliae]|uniref:Uncharacterized protein n=1 Tax=Heyndrickxia camelliae TaxID=1707093 RepID=A0A2N3LGC8_9BACI|nr:hypothetical protein CWO92_18310 [Heyndrickxia camelliae]